MTSADAFFEARNLLLRLRTDQAAALREFRWPQLNEFNWALDYFDAMARGNEAPALHIVGEDGSEVKRSFRELSERSSQVANHLRGLGVARGGGGGENSSGDIFLAFATGNRGMQVGDAALTATIQMLSDDHISELFWATIEATEEAILNSLVAAETMVGRDGITFHALPHDRLVEVMRRYGRLG